jgi:hypothetical protein
MYLGLDFLIAPDLSPRLVEVNVGLPGGAQEYHLTQLVATGKPPGIFERIQRTSLNAYGMTFEAYLASLPWIGSLKPFKLWMDGMGPFPGVFHPGLRFEDKWIQYGLLRDIAPMPVTERYELEDRAEAERFLRERGRLVLKRRVGRGGRGLRIVNAPADLPGRDEGDWPCLLQEHVESKVGHFALSIRSVAFGGAWMCMYANLAGRSWSNHGILAGVAPGGFFGLEEEEFRVVAFNERSWEAGLWFGPQDPAYLRHNLYEDEVAETSLRIPEDLYRTIIRLSVAVERVYEGIDPSSLPEACFERSVAARETQEPWTGTASGN